MSTQASTSCIIPESSISKLPKRLTFKFLDNITNHFSKEQEIGNPGGLGTVYKGNLEDRTVIAVKKHTGNAPGTRETEAYTKKVQSIMMHNHENIAKLLAFCLEERKDAFVQYGNSYVTQDIVESLFCYQYFPKGNLHTHIFGSSKIDWNTRFNIIKGICRGLCSLHMSDDPIIHLNLKPQNILLDENMVPKITDFMYTRIVGKEHTRKNTMSIVGSRGYKAPEYVERGEISRRTDIYALGLMILEITTREKNSPSEKKETARDYINKVEETWYPSDMRREAIMSQYPDLDANCRREVELCIQIGLQSVNLVANKRPTIDRIVRELSA